jgi:hypothetical protein
MIQNDPDISRYIQSRFTDYIKTIMYPDMILSTCHTFKFTIISQVDFKKCVQIPKFAMELFQSSEIAPLG